MLVRILAWLAIVLACVATLWGALIVADGNYCWSAFAFTMMTSGLSAGVLFLGVVPSWLRYSKTRQPEDRTTLRMAGYSFLVLVVEAIALQILPQRGE
jgi:hypothetical protein